MVGQCQDSQTGKQTGDREKQKTEHGILRICMHSNFIQCVHTYLSQTEDMQRDEGTVFGQIYVICMKSVMDMYTKIGRDCLQTEINMQR